MIIFNAQAVVVTLIAAVLSIPFFILRHFNLIDEELLLIFVSWVILLSSAFCKYADINGRLFFIPMWILSIPLPFLMTFGSYGWPGILSTLGIFLGIVALFLFYIFIQEKTRVKNLSDEKITVPSANKGSSTYIEDIKKLFFFPTFVRTIKEIYRHNLKVVALIESEGLLIEGLAEFKSQMRRGSQGNNNLDKVVIRNFERELEVIWKEAIEDEAAQEELSKKRQQA